MIEIFISFILSVILITSIFYFSYYISKKTNKGFPEILFYSFITITVLIILTSILYDTLF